MKRRRRLLQFFVSLVFLWGCGTFLNPIGAVAETNQEMFRLAFTGYTLSEVSENDAMVAIKGELNSQLQQRLEVFTSSPEFVTSVFCFRKYYNDSIRQIIISELTQIMKSPSGEQIMTLFQLGAFEAQPTSFLDSAFKLLATHERLLDKTKMTL